MVERKRTRDSHDDEEEKDLSGAEDIKLFERMLRIDKNDLDTVLETLGDVFYRVSKMYTIAISVADEAKAYIDEVEAELDKQVRQQAFENEEKVNETMVKQRIALMPKMQRAIRDHLEKRKQAGMWLSMKESFAQRSYAIKELVSLYGQQYFEVSGVDRAKRERVDTKVEEAQRARTEALERKRKRNDDE